jgi:hypothetical protein
MHSVIGTDTILRQCGHLREISKGSSVLCNLEVSKARFPQSGHFIDIAIATPYKH